MDDKAMHEAYLLLGSERERAIWDRAARLLEDEEATTMEKALAGDLLAALTVLGHTRRARVQVVL